MKIIKIISSVLFVAMLTACVKSTDNNFVNSGGAGSPNVVSFQNISGTGPYGYSLSTKVNQTIGAVASSTPTTFAITVQLTSTDGSYPSTSVTINNTPAVLTQFNTDNATSYSVLPDSTFSWVNKTATVDPATHIATFTFSLSSGKVDLTQAYALGISILSVSNSGVSIPANTSTKVLVVKIKNPYDGSYTVNGYFFHPSSPRAITAKTKSIYTISGVRSTTDLGDLGSSSYQFNFDVDPASKSLTNWAEAGATPAVPASGFMTLDNPAKIPTYPGTTTGFVAKTYNNTYDVAKSIFWMHYGYGVGTTSQNAFTRQVYEKWERQ